MLLLVGEANVTERLAYFNSFLPLPETLNNSGTKGVLEIFAYI